MALLERSTNAWHQTLAKFVRAPMVPRTATNNQMAPPLQIALRRRGNQFALLLDIEDVGCTTDFPTNTLNYGDGTCWVECSLQAPARSKFGDSMDKLMVVMR
jgi:hypothetical protein